jgi:S1-C subfamily serine protease
MLEPGGGRRRGGGGRRLGVMLDENTISEVMADSAAEKAGMKAGDKIVKIGDQEVSDRQSLIRAIMGGDPKKKVVFVREGKRMEAIIEWPQLNRRPQNRPAPEEPKEEKKEEKKRGAVR